MPVSSLLFQIEYEAKSKLNAVGRVMRSAAKKRRRVNIGRLRSVAEAKVHEITHAAAREIKIESAFIIIGPRSRLLLSV